MMPTPDPLVSIVIIFLNAERFLEQAVASVFRQTYLHWELFLVDDGSTDASARQAQRFATERSGQVKYLTHPGRQNRGMSASRNLGIRHAAGDLIALLDADDEWVADKLARQVAMMTAYPEAAMLYGPALYWHEDDPKRDFVQATGFSVSTSCPPLTLATKFLCDSAGTPGTSGMLLRAEIVRHLGGFVDDFRSMYEDQAFCFKLAVQTTIVAAPECWYRYRQHAGSCCSIAFAKGDDRAARRRYLDWCTRYLDTLRIVDPELRAVLGGERRAASRGRHAVRAARRHAGRLLPRSVRAWLQGNRCE